MEGTQKRRQVEGTQKPAAAAHATAAVTAAEREDAEPSEHEAEAA